MGIQPLTRAWPMSQPINLNMSHNLSHNHNHNHVHNHNNSAPSYKLLYNPPQTYSSIQSQNQSQSQIQALNSGTNSIYEQHERFALEQEYQRQRDIKQQQYQIDHDYETISQLKEDVSNYEKYKTLIRSSPLSHPSPSPAQSLSETVSVSMHQNRMRNRKLDQRPKSMIMLEKDPDFQQNYKLVPQSNNNNKSCSNIVNNNNNNNCNSSQSIGVVMNGMDNLSLSKKQTSTATSSGSSLEIEMQTFSRNDPSLRRLSSTATPTCVPWLKRIKVIKRIKRGIGLGSSKSGTQFNNLPALNFHPVHGENVQLFNDGSVAKRINSFCKAIAFTDRPVKINEKVCLRLIQVSSNWSGVLRFGVTNHDPSTLKNCLPKYVCPDLTSRPGFWAKAFNDHLVKEGMTINFHINSSGEIVYSINGEDKGIFLSNVDVRAPLWCVIDVYGNTTAIQLVDPRSELNNSRPPSSTSGNCSYSLEASISTPSLSSSHRLTPVPTYSQSSLACPSSSSGSGQGAASPKILLNPQYSTPFQKTIVEPSHSHSQSYSHPLSQPPPHPHQSQTQSQQSSSPCHLRGSSTYVQLPPQQQQQLQQLQQLPQLKQLSNCKSTPSLHAKNPNSQSQSNSNQIPPIYQSMSQFTTCSTSTSSSQSAVPNSISIANRPPLQLPVYKTPPPPKRIDDYEYIYSIKSAGNPGNSGNPRCYPNSNSNSNPAAGPSNSNNYVSIPSLSMINKSRDFMMKEDVKGMSSFPSSESKLKALMMDEEPSKIQSSNNNCSPNGNGNAKVSNSMSTSPSSTSSSSPHRSSNEIQLECLACCERAVDSVFYSCGHMCMCIQCAMETFKSKMCCPICRANVTDVIRTYT